MRLAACSAGWCRSTGQPLACRCQHAHRPGAALLCVPPTLPPLSLPPRPRRASQSTSSSGWSISSATARWGHISVLRNRGSTGGGWVAHLTWALGQHRPAACLLVLQRMMALNLPALASELVPPPKAHAPTAKHKGGRGAHLANGFCGHAVGACAT